MPPRGAPARGGVNRGGPARGGAMRGAPGGRGVPPAAPVRGAAATRARPPAAVPPQRMAPTTHTAAASENYGEYVSTAAGEAKVKAGVFLLFFLPLSSIVLDCSFIMELFSNAWSAKVCVKHTGGCLKFMVHVQLFFKNIFRCLFQGYDENYTDASYESYDNYYTQPQGWENLTSLTCLFWFF